jgi:hypothetical protein
MRIVGRYFAVGATLGSVASLATLVLIWSWMAIHLGVLGFLLGWIPAGLAAAAVWLIMVVFWGPIVVVAAMVVAALLAWTISGGREHAWREPPAASEPDEAPTPPAPEEFHPPGPRDQPEPPPVEAPPAAAPPEQPDESPAPGAPPVSSAPPAPPPRTLVPRGRQTDDLGGDAAAAGDTSRKPPR